MALEYWELRQRQKGNIAGAEIARVLREQYGDETIGLETPDPHERAKNVKAELLGLGISLRTANHILRAVRAEQLSITRATDLRDVPDDELRQVRLVGPKTLRDVRQVLPYTKPPFRP